MADAPLPAFPADGATIVQSRAKWSIELGRLHLALTRTKEMRVVSPGLAGTGRGPARRRSFWPLAAGGFVSVSAFGLAVFGALASPRLLPASPYVLSVAVPGVAATSSPASPQPRLAYSRPAAHSTEPGRLHALAAETPFGARDEHYVRAAMRTGELQEWRDDAGLPRFLTAGPARDAAGRRCRDLALLVHLSDGGSEVTARRRCVPADARDAEPIAAAHDDEAGASNVVVAGAQATP